MISEHQFATGYQSIWNQIAPLSDGYWHFENMLVKREEPPLNGTASKNLRGVINETAFRTFCVLRTERGTFNRLRVFSVIDTIVPEAVLYVKRFTPHTKLDIEVFDEACRREAAILALRLLHYFRGILPTQLRPTFPGCGLISSCEGDIIEGTCLYEVKAGDRAFRITDLRQLLIYSALAYSAGTLTFKSIGLFNPRTGVVWSRTLDQVCQSIAGTQSVDTMSAIVNHFSAVSVSR